MVIYMIKMCVSCGVKRATIQGVLCHKCFVDSEKTIEKEIMKKLEELEKQLKTNNEKLDKIIKIIKGNI